MKKQLLVLSSFLLISCGGSDLLNSQEEVQTSKILDKNSLAQSKLSSLTNKTETVVMDIPFVGKAQPSGGGCTVINIDNQATPHETTAAFGPNPISYYGRLIRGYGGPRMYWPYWPGLLLRAKNKPKTIISRGQSLQVDNPFENAISIEFPFESNLTYEITISTSVWDEVYRAKHDEFSGNNHLYNVNQSEGFPTVAVELSSSPQISGNDPCAERPVVGNGLASANYYKKQKAEMTTSPSYEKKTFIFNFSITNPKSALLLYFLPQKSENQYIPENDFDMYIENIKIVQKPFDPTHVVPDTRPNSNPCGFRGGC